MHPSVLLSIWLFVVLLVQTLPAAVLTVIVGTTAFFCSPNIRASFIQLIRRSRWVLLTLLLTFVLLTPGERVVPDYPLTKEGLGSGFEHLLRLLAVLLAVAWLVGGRTTEWLLSALLGVIHLFCPKCGSGFVVRLALTIRYAAGDFVRQSWRALVSAHILPVEAGLHTHIDLSHREMSPLERRLAIGFLLAGVLALVVVR